MPEVCSDCGGTFASTADLVAHMKSAHEGGNAKESMAMNPESEIPGVRCALCGARFSNPKDLAAHNLKPHGEVTVAHQRRVESETTP